MKENFKQFLKHTLEVEGGYVNDPDDSGGETNYGITRDTYQHYLFKKHNARIVVKDMRDIPMSDVEDIYRTEYWDKISADELPSGIDIMLADFAVNSGVVRATRKFQKLFDTERDGIIGRHTLSCVNEKVPEWLLHNLFVIRREYYHNIGHINNNKKFLKGWYNRLNSVYSVCHDLVY